MEQARKWAALLLPRPADVDQERNIARLWILWKLGMKDEFKTLSGIVQRHAEDRLDQAVGLSQVALPQSIIGKFVFRYKRNPILTTI
jgi:hypothetical protein